MHLPQCHPVERRKATWGSRVVSTGRSALTRLFGQVSVILAIAIISTAAAQAEAQTPAALKLDPSLRARVNVAGYSKVIVELYDNADDSSVVGRVGEVGRKLDAMKGRVLRVANSRLLLLASHSRVKRVIEDRPVEGLNGRTTITIGSRPVIDLMGWTGAGIGVAVIDSGVAGYHYDLTLGRGDSGGAFGLRVAHFKDFVNDRTDPYDDWGHGTHVAGTIAGTGLVSYGRHEGVAPGANIVALKVLDENGLSTISTIIAAIDYAIAIKDTYNIRVMNLSLGAGVFESYTTDPLAQATKRAVDAGIVVVAAAGNLGRTRDNQRQFGAVTVPGNAPWNVTVGASSTQGTLHREDDDVALYSSNGPTYFDFSAKPDLVAPGTGTVSLVDPLSAFYVTRSEALIPGLMPGLPHMPYLSLSGTSMATPAVAGTVALMLHANPSLTPNLVKAILQFTAQNYPGYHPLTEGTGFLNAKAAVTLAEFFRTGRAGDRYPNMKGWSRTLFWGNWRVRGGVLAANGTAWGRDVEWGKFQTPSGQPVVWGENCTAADCSDVFWGSNIVWGDTCSLDPVCDSTIFGATDGDNIVWGNGDRDNIVWGNSGDDNIVWGNDCNGDDCLGVVWGFVDADNIVWGNTDGDNIVWGNDTRDPDNIVWGNGGDDNIVWGNTGDAGPATYGDYWYSPGYGGSPIDTFDPRWWDVLFEYSVDVLEGRKPSNAPPDLIPDPTKLEPNLNTLPPNQAPPLAPTDLASPTRPPAPPL